MNKNSLITEKILYKHLIEGDKLRFNLVFFSFGFLVVASVVDVAFIAVICGVLES
jgi:hypothetical protein